MSQRKSSIKSITKTMASMNIKASPKLYSKNSDEAKTFDNLPDDMLLELMIRMNNETLQKFRSISDKYETLYNKSKTYIFSRDGIIRDVNSKVWSVSWSPDSSKIVTGHNDGSICIWNTNTGELLQTLEGHIDEIKSVAWSPKGDQIASGSVDDKIFIWDVKTGKKNYEVEEVMTIDSISWNHKGTKLAVGGIATVDILDIDILQHSELRAGSDMIFDVSWSPDGNKVVAGGRDKMIRIWDLNTREIIRVLRGHKSEIWSVAWSPDGTKIASAGKDHDIRIWNALTGKRLGILRGHTDIVWDISWNPESNKIVSASEDKTIRIWDINTKETLHVIDNNEKGVENVAWSPDGTKIATTSYHKIIRIFKVSDLLQIGGKTRLRRKTVKKT